MCGGEGGERKREREKRKREREREATREGRGCQQGVWCFQVLPGTPLLELWAVLYFLLEHVGLVPLVTPSLIRHPPVKLVHQTMPPWVALEQQVTERGPTLRPRLQPANEMHREVGETNFGAAAPYGTADAQPPQLGVEMLVQIDALLQFGYKLLYAHPGVVLAVGTFAAPLAGFVAEAGVRVEVLHVVVLVGNRLRIPRRKSADRLPDKREECPRFQHFRCKVRSVRPSSLPGHRETKNSTTPEYTGM